MVDDEEQGHVPFSVVELDTGAPAGTATLWSIDNRGPHRLQFGTLSDNTPDAARRRAQRFRPRKRAALLGPGDG